MIRDVDYDPGMTTNSSNDRRNALQRFFRLESAGGLMLMGATVLAMAVANSPLVGEYERVWRLPFEIRLGDVGLAKPLILWINDGLMAIFFFLIGLELKREVVEGHLSSVRKASLPALAALGGLVTPAAIYWLFNRGDPAAIRGWAIPAATDIAFALGVLSLLGRRVPTGLKALLLSLAIFDDVGAILIIAVFYTAELSLPALAIAALFIGGLAAMSRRRVTAISPYLVLGTCLWIAVLKSGVHATLAGVAVALFIPMTRRRRGERESTMLHELEQGLHPWVAFGVLPLFAFANAGIPLGRVSFSDLLSPIPLGIILGLFIGKQVGVMALTWISVRLGIAALPAGVGWPALYGMAALAGIGFTMSLFVASLAFLPGGEVQPPGVERLGILVGSLLAGILGYFVLRTVTPAASDSG